MTTFLKTDDTVALHLKAGEVQYIYSVLAKRPYEEVAQLMMSIAQQIDVISKEAAQPNSDATVQ